MDSRDVERGHPEQTGGGSVCGDRCDTQSTDIASLDFESLAKMAEETSVSIAGYRKLGRALPGTDSDLDRFFTHLLGNRKGQPFVSAMIAALDCGRPVQARHLVRGVEWMRQDTQIPALATRCVGQVDRALLQAEARSTTSVQTKASCLLAAAWWRHRNIAAPAYGDACDRAVALFPLADTDEKAPVILGALCMLLDRVSTLYSWPAMQAFMNSSSRNKARTHLQNVAAYTARPVLAPLADFERSMPHAPKARQRNSDGARIGRNDPCPCGSGAKYKKCCGRQR
jgi:hypothetical protein